MIALENICKILKYFARIKIKDIKNNCKQFHWVILHNYRFAYFQDNQTCVCTAFFKKKYMYLLSL